MTNQGSSLVWQMGGLTLDYIVGSPVVWQTTTHFKVIMDDTRYSAVGGDFDHKPLRLRLSIDYSFVEPRHRIETKKFLPRFKYDKSKVEEYQLALRMSLGNLWVIDLIGHLGADELADTCVGVTSESIFGNKPWRGSYRKRHCHKLWFDVDCRTTKHELRL